MKPSTRKIELPPSTQLQKVVFGGSHMRHIFIAVMVLLIGGRAHAQVFTLLSDNRFESVSITSPSPPATSSNYFATQIPSAPFADFQGDVSGRITWPSNSILPYPGADSSSEAMQSSTITPTQFTCSGRLYTQCGGYWLGVNPIELEGVARAASVFDVSFSISSPLAYNLSYSSYLIIGDGDWTLSLTSVNHGTILTGGLYPGGNQVSGVLEPDTYDFHCAGEISNFYSDVPGGALLPDLVFTVVPEPSSGLLLVTTLLGLAALRGKLAAIT